ncbi:hypothetical protein [uncultured Ruthenibacterium sp.]|uniref:hypothetical protein n=1 Tax=uncultured Ruthenibacterium sp. TaxID=1905347 RepID=UPI00349EEBCC
MRRMLMVGLIRTGVVLLMFLAICGLGVYEEGTPTVAMLVTPGAFLLAWGLYQIDEHLCVVQHKRYKVKRVRIRMATSSSKPMRVA